MGYTEVLTGQGVAVDQWESQIFSEYLGQVFWSSMMGASTNAVIQVKDDLSKAAGDAINIGLRSQLKGGKVTGNNKGIGNEGTVEFYNQRIVIDNVRHLVKFEDVPMSQQRTAFNILNEGREALIEKNAFALEDDITTALTTIGTERVRGRYLYGAADSNWHGTHATALQNIDNSADQLTVAMINVAKRKALIPNNATAKIRPMRVNTGQNVEEYYAFVGHTLALRDLVENDAQWKNSQLNLPPSANRESPLFTGARFKGQYNGVLIYEYDRMPLVSSTIQCAHNLLLGAQAGACVWGQRSKFGEEESDIGHDISYETHEIRGDAKTVFNRAEHGGTNEDHGLINVFSAAVAD